ncbi:MAG TPA: tetratricopeptide repeat protein [Chryseosolibacter sp.]|nr:tetratricopeptide repeat protein [Chryseosolibacter sp.]
MKRLAFLVLMLAAFSVLAQKPQKPNLNKALKLWQEGKLSEAKEMIDLATTYEKTKDDGKTWYYHGLIYASLDTTSNPQYKSLVEDPLGIAVKSFAKADSLAGKYEYTVTPLGGVIPETKPQQILNLANYYMRKAGEAYEKDSLEAALGLYEKTQRIYPDDTTAFFYGAILANAIEQYDKAITYFQEFYKRGGKSPDGYAYMLNIYSGIKDDKEKALAMAREAKAKFPENTEFPKTEIGLLIDLNRVDEAKVGLEQAVVREPGNKIFHFFLGYVNSRQEKWDDAKKNFEAALKIDPNYFEAQYYLAQVYLIDANKVKEQMKGLGISAADKKKAAELDKVLVEKYKQALPHWERAEKLKGDDTDVLDMLRTIYYYLGDDKNENRVLAKLKQLGVEN